MAKKTKRTISKAAPKVKRPPRFEDFLEPNPFVWPWMLKYLPANQRIRDIVVVCLSTLLAYILSVSLYALGANEFFSIGTGGLVLTLFHGDALSRNMIAGMNFRRAKRNGDR